MHNFNAWGCIIGGLISLCVRILRLQQDLEPDPYYSSSLYPGLAHLTYVGSTQQKHNYPQTVLSSRAAYLTQSFQPNF